MKASITSAQAMSHPTVVETINALGQMCDELRTENTALRTAAQAVIDRWDTPNWKDAPATAEYINRLREALK